MDKVLKLKKCVKSIALEAEKFFIKHNNSAGTRLRKRLQACKKISQDLRIMVQKAKFKYIQKKALIKARAAAFGGEKILNSRNLRLKCLRENKFINSKIQNTEYFFGIKEAVSLEYVKDDAINSGLESFLDPNIPPPITSYSIFKFN